MRHTTGIIWALFDKPVRMYRGNTLAGCIKDERYHKPSREFVGGYYMQTMALTCNKGLVDFYQGVIADPTNTGNTDVTGDLRNPAAGREATTKLNSPNPLYPSEN